MKKTVKTCVCAAAAICVVSSATLISYADGVSFPKAGATSALNEYIASTSGSQLPGAGVSLTLSNYYAANPNAESDAEVVDYLVPKVKSEYEDIAIAQVSDYVNIRNASNEEGEILGKLYNNSAARVVGEEGDWYQITSGSVTGFVKKDYVRTGEEGSALAEQVGTKIATVTTETLKVRENAGMDSPVVTLVSGEEEINVLEAGDEWTKVSLDADVVGYVANDYVTVRTEFVQAESIEEEKARLAKEEAERKAAEEAARKADEAAKKKAAAEKAAAAEKEAAAKKKAAQKAAAQEKKSSESAESSSKNSSSEAETPQEEKTSSYSAPASGSRQSIVSYALQFVGNPYVAGGTSLTKGADCSGFVQSVFRDCGYSLPRSSREQAGSGREVSLDQIQPGDLLFYSKGGSISHVALYIGNGQIVHASTYKTGIKISNYNYRTPCKAVSYVD